MNWIQNPAGVSRGVTATDFTKNAIEKIIRGRFWPTPFNYYIEILPTFAQESSTATMISGKS